MTRGYGRRLLPLAMLASFGTGILVDGWLRTYGPPTPVQAATDPTPPASPAAAPPDRPVQPTPDRVGAAPAPLSSTVVSGFAESAIGAATVVSRDRFRLPIDGVGIESFKGGFSEARGSRRHEAVDIAAPLGTPVRAVQDGTVAKLFLSKPGGNTIYEFDANGRLCYYYAHLDRYADGLRDRQHVSRGEIMGYVGSSGNASPLAPHLHFAIFELDADRKWWRGRPLDPYLVFGALRDP